MDKAKIAKLCNEIEDIVCDISRQTMNDIVSAESRMIFDKSKELAAEITAPPKNNDEHTAAYWMKKTMDATHEAYDRLKDTVDFKNAIAEVEAIKQRMGIGETKKITNADRIRQMTDEELAERFGFEECKDSRYGYECPGWHAADCGHATCKKYFLEWLKQEVSMNDKSGGDTDG